MNLIYHPDIDKIVENHFDRVCTKLKNPTSTRKYYSSSVYEKIESKIQKYNGKNELNLFEHLLKIYSKLIKDKIEKLERHIIDINSILKTENIVLYTINQNTKEKNYTEVYEDIKECFDYDSFGKSDKAYSLLFDLNINVCPYCNRQFINTFISPNGKTRATLDHFYCKSEYPYLALSFYNLIPSCYSCNSSLKGSKKFNFKNNVNPYHSSFENIVSFTINYKKINDSEKYIAEFYNDPKFMKIEFKSHIHKNKNDYKKVEKNIKVFKLQELYNLHKDIVLRLIQQDVIYDKAGLANTIAKSYPKIFKDQNEVLKTMIGYNYNHYDFNKIPFSRLLRDISIELKLNTKLSI